MLRAFITASEQKKNARVVVVHYDQTLYPCTRYAGGMLSAHITSIQVYLYVDMTKKKLKLVLTLSGKTFLRDVCNESLG